MIQYWKFGKRDSARLVKVIESQNVVIDEAIAMSKKMGFDKKQVITGRSFFREQVCGFIAREGQEIDEKVWCKVKSFNNGWRPRRLKKNKELNEMFDGWDFSVSDSLCRELGLDNFIEFSVYTLGAIVVEGYVFIQFYECMGVPNCGSQISNITFNKWKKRNEEFR